MSLLPPAYPLSESSLPRVQLDAPTLTQWKTQAKEIVRSVVRNRKSWYFCHDQYEKCFRPLFNKPNARGCARVIQARKRHKSDMIEYMTRAELDLTLHDIEYALHCETTTQQRAVFSQLYQKSCLDGALLELHEGSTPVDPFHCISTKWLAMELAKTRDQRDYVYFEYCYTTRDAEGRKVLIEYKNSQFYRPDLIVKDHGLQIKRGGLYVLNTYHMEDKKLIMHSLGTHDISDSSSALFAPSIASAMYGSILSHCELANVRAVSDAGLTPNSLVPRRKQEVGLSCRSCDKRFKVTRGKKWCCGCGLAVCRKCVKKVILCDEKPQASVERLPFVKEKFCLPCLVSARVQFANGLGTSSRRGHKFADSGLSSTMLSVDDLRRQRSRDRSMLNLFPSFLRMMEDEEKEEEEMYGPLPTIDDEGQASEVHKPFNKSSSNCSVETEGSSTESMAAAPIHAAAQPDFEATLPREASVQVMQLQSIYEEWERASFVFQQPKSPKVSFRPRSTKSGRLSIYD